MLDFFTLVTDIGRAKIAAFAAGGPAVELTHIAVGDGLDNAYYIPEESQLALKHEVWRGSINNILTPLENPGQIIVEGLLPEDEGGWTIRELGIFDADGDMIGVGKYPESYKATPAEGVGQAVYLRPIFNIVNAAAVTLSINPDLVMASVTHVRDALIEAGFGTPVILEVETNLTSAHGTLYLKPPEGETVLFHLPAYGTVSAAKNYRLKNIGMGLAHIDTPDATLIDGVDILELMPGDRNHIGKDGNNWQTH